MEDPPAGKERKGATDTKSVDKNEEEGCFRGLLEWLPCFRSYRGEKGEYFPLREVVMNAPFTTDSDLLYRHEFTSNYISTTRYTLWNFIFLNLFEQFQKAANFYFLIMAIITAIPGVSTIPLYATTTPLVFVLAVTAIKDGIDDYGRYRSDKEVNAREVDVVNPGGSTTKYKWEDLKVGHVVKVKKDEAFPADLVILASASANGECGIQTANLDGETNIKTRQALKETARMSVETLGKPGGIRILCERPHAGKEFEGRLLIGPGSDQSFSLNNDNVLLRGATLKETKYIYGVIIYTGEQTKVMIHNDPPRFKRSHMDVTMNKQMYLIFLLQFCIIFTATVLSGWFYTNRGDRHWYLGIDDTSTNEGTRQAIINFCAFYVLLSVMVPISLYVSMELVRVGQALLIGVDNRMYDPEDGKFCSARSTTLSEELGQIQYVFSDKTGTLTSNQMAFEKASINGRLYGTREEVKDLKVDKDPHPSRQKTNAFSPGRRAGDKETLLGPEGDEKFKIVSQDATINSERFSDAVVMDFDGDPRFCNMSDNSLRRALLDGDQSARDYVLALALCQTVTVNDDPNRPGRVTYQGESTDEVALVTAASMHGVRFVKKKRNEVTLVIPWETSPSESKEMKVMDMDRKESEHKRGGTRKISGSRVVFKILQILAFTSDRKRMSVIVQFPDGTIRVLTKGADNKIKAISSNDKSVNSKKLWEQTDAHLFQFSREGLRVMLVGQRKLTESEYRSWNAEYEAASKSFADEKGNRKQKMEKVAEKIEGNLQVLGVTAIEDKLQEGVPQTLRLLKKAGIRIWVLTGDKQNTAVNIGKSCGLIGWDYQLVYIRSKQAGACKEEMEGILQALSNAESESAALMVSGDSLKASLIPGNRDTLFSVMNHPKIRVVVASRMTPAQKRDIVTLVKEKLGVVTLAIGDGANDVSMIRAAHVGVGLRGKEGMQAANSSDFAISKFRFLSQLLLVHGTLSYSRNSTLILYFFYKNVMMAVQQIFFIFFSGYSSEEVFDGYMLNTFNLCWTALPILFFSVFDRPANVDELLEFPQLYLPGLRGEYFNFRTFWLSFVEAIVHGAIVWLVTWFTLHNIFDSYWASSVGTYTAVVIVANTKMTMITTTWFWFNALILFLTVLVYFMYIFLHCGPIGFEFSPWLFGVINQVMREPVFYLVLIFLSFGVFLQDFTVAYVKRIFCPSLLQLVQECRGDVALKQKLIVALNEGVDEFKNKWTQSDHEKKVKMVS
mmetsp:Transcript_16015/g.24131  ORF Transcript_16015/g.24131 Transcript_16015/m.24131 type:complete len:1238 (+) Transcript_16015:26-3739(+)